MTEKKFDSNVYWKRLNTPLQTNAEKAEVLKQRNYTDPKLLEKVGAGTLTEENLDDYDYFSRRNVMAFYKSGLELCLTWE